ncbi:UDP-N-acetylglucosamine--N-acetylmuramyl-(pentapeptide) pyrophosphoryl-undecaprenol N-acetylglucosamine transferase [Candidatus Daviesbacteria bacterium]|nr:UDP-N-acetylglucosamine--N-acetylmuramyl-(pentapeptide) pyrophosphoryl-undecaprenol N-acetylglucosamine transferase [Candidatus Daviesbacteria bacterium]
MKIMVTGAHFTPAVATIEELKKIGGSEVVYVGRSTTLEGDRTLSVESKVLPSLGVKFIPIIAGRLQRSLTIFTVFSLLKIPIGFLQALFIVLLERPDVILSFGGYVAVPIVIAGWFFSVPVIIHEQGLVVGLANRISSVFADKIAVSFKNSDFKGDGVILTGNPIRSEILEKRKGVKLKHPEGVGPGKLPVVLIMGGNQGSHVINLAVEQCLEKLLKVAEVVHQTGDSKYKDYERLEELGRLGVLGKRYGVKKWIGENYGDALQEADLVVSRAGINTLTELALLGKPALLVPISNSEQNKNARYFESLGLAKILPQSKLSAEALFENIVVMLKNLDKLKQNAKEAEKIIVPYAAKRLALETMLLAKNPGVHY